MNEPKSLKKKRNPTKDSGIDLGNGILDEVQKYQQPVSGRVNRRKFVRRIREEF